MQQLNLPKFSFRIKNNEKHIVIFDEFRKKDVVLTPEEWVRQNFLKYLVQVKRYPVSLIAIEKQLIINNLKKRTDILIFSSDGLPNIIVECKAPSIKITQETFDQIARYNLKLKANFLIVTNGLQHYYCSLDLEKQSYVFLEDIPTYSS